MTRNALLDRAERIAPVQTGYLRVRDLIRMDIISGALKPGARLKIAELAERYATSGVPVREALQQLQGEGLVTFVANRGASVRAIDGNFLRDIHEIRALIEPFLLQWFVRNHRESDIQALEDIQREYDAVVAAGDLDRTHEINRAFHEICYSGHYNQEALTIANLHTDLIGALVERFPRSRARCQAISREHWGIIGAIREQDEGRASRLMQEHVRRAGQHMIETVQGALRDGEAAG
jgi:DNA-binding GntR family transcriptional regulator